MIVFKKFAILGGIVGIFLTFLKTADAHFQKKPEMICASQPIKAAPGDDVIFLCSVNEWDATRHSVEWSRPDLRQDSKKKYVLVYRSQDVDRNQTMESYIGRVSLFPEALSSGNVSLKLSNVTVNDSGQYKCYLRSLNASAVFNLSVTDGKDKISKSQDRTDTESKVEQHWWVVVLAEAHKVAPFVDVAVVVVVAVVIGGNYLLKKCKKKKKKRSLNKTDTPPAGLNSDEDETRIHLTETS
ncbi:butyrophilin-like protein 2 isoform X2 [Poecilia reticulata]|uniref:butyrophilin-like protein 2 isoform X2 n=1 Tax=Poecilia reticulata TaxID=8081 RepID=UPI0004A43ABA|nr:PREDICTED: butyrophilin-like protein 2 isoform X2 [Poecilia reticulata]